MAKRYGIMNKAIFIDKDGTLIKDVPYNVDPSLVVLEPNAANALELLKRNNYKLIVISNQSGVAQGYFKEAELENVKARIQELLKENDVCIDAFYFCPHHPDGREADYSVKCECRKPQPGMILQAAIDYNVDLSQSWMIGDILNDVEAGNKASCKTILINNGNETEWKTNEVRWPTYIVQNLMEAATLILQTEKNVERELELPEHH
jgi:D-glycero-D-manno-heptose 1,7-bisphosphate phosphatase